jgi:hypothetical protein
MRFSESKIIGYADSEYGHDICYRPLKADFLENQVATVKKFFSKIMF